MPFLTAPDAIERQAAIIAARLSRNKIEVTRTKV